MTEVPGINIFNGSVTVVVLVSVVDFFDFITVIVVIVIVIVIIYLDIVILEGRFISGSALCIVIPLGSLRPDISLLYRYQAHIQTNQSIDHSRKTFRA